MAKKVSVKHNIDDLRRGLALWQSRLPVTLREMGRPIFTRIGARAIGSHMRNASPEAAGTRNTTTILRIITGRLARSLSGAQTLGNREAVNRIEPRGPSSVAFIKGSKVPYAGIHEGGGTILNRSRVRGITAEELRRGIITINIPRRPYLGPALKEETPWIERLAARRLATSLRASIKEAL